MNKRVPIRLRHETAEIPISDTIFCLFSGFQDTSATARGSVAYLRRSGTLSTAYCLLYICKALLPSADQLQGEQKVTVMIKP